MPTRGPFASRAEKFFPNHDCVIDTRGNRTLLEDILPHQPRPLTTSMAQRICVRKPHSPPSREPYQVSRALRTAGYQGASALAYRATKLKCLVDGMGPSPGAFSRSQMHARRDGESAASLGTNGQSMGSATMLCLCARSNLGRSLQGFCKPLRINLQHDKRFSGAVFPLLEACLSKPP